MKAICPIPRVFALFALSAALLASPALAESGNVVHVTPLMRAAASALTEEGERELLARATPLELNAQDSQGRTALDYALSDAPDMLAQSAVQDLLIKGAMPGSGEAAFPLQVARLAVSRRGGEIPGLLSPGVKVDERLPNGFTAFLWAVAYAPPEAVQALVQAGANPKQTLPEQVRGSGEKHGDNAVVIAAQSNSGNSGPTMQALLKMGLSPNSVSFFTTALILACQNPDTGAAFALIDAGADVHMRDGVSNSAFLAAGGNPNGLLLLKTLVSKGVDTQAIMDDVGINALHNAARGNPNREVLIFLLNQGLPINEATGEEGGSQTPLMLAVRHNPNPEIIRILLQRGANPAKKDANGKLAWEDISAERLAWLRANGLDRLLLIP